MIELLRELEVERLETREQHRVGLAVARRWASSRTFVAHMDVIEPLAQGVEQYPGRFCEGVIEGLLIESEGYLRLTAGNVSDLDS